jgi:TPR repeat protein
MPLRYVFAAFLLTAAAPPPNAVKAGVEAWQRGQPAAAIALWRTAALAGDANAQFNLGQAYKLGRGVAVDLKAAEEWFRLAALQGHRAGEDQYGFLLFENGKRAESMAWIRKSAARGEPRAQYVLGTAHFNGDLAERDLPRAYALMRQSAAAGIPQAATSLALIEKNISVDDRRRGMALLAQRPAGETPEWRVQLGAFSEEDRARQLWTRLIGNIPALAPLQPRYVRSSRLTRLLAGPLQSKTEAEKLCRTIKASGNVCIAVTS